MLTVIKDFLVLLKDFIAKLKLSSGAYSSIILFLIGSIVIGLTYAPDYFAAKAKEDAIKDLKEKQFEEIAKTQQQILQDQVKKSDVVMIVDTIVTKRTCQLKKSIEQSNKEYVTRQINTVIDHIDDLRENSDLIKELIRREDFEIIGARKESLHMRQDNVVVVPEYSEQEIMPSEQSVDATAYAYLYSKIDNGHLYSEEDMFDEYVDKKKDGFFKRLFTKKK